MNEYANLVEIFSKQLHTFRPKSNQTERKHTISEKKKTVSKVGGPEVMKGGEFSAMNG